MPPRTRNRGQGQPPVDAQVQAGVPLGEADAQVQEGAQAGHVASAGDQGQPGAQEGMGRRQAAGEDDGEGQGGAAAYDAERENELGDLEGDARDDRRWELREERLLQRLRAERVAVADSRGLSEASVGRALFSIKPLVEKDFEVWLQSVSDAFWGAGLFPMFRLSAVPSDHLATQTDRAGYVSIPDSYKGLAWAALKASIGPETAAYAALMSVDSGDVLGLLRTMRLNFERKSIPFRHQLLSDLSKTNLADHPGVRQYVATLDTFFTRLARLNHPVADKDKLYHLTQGLTEEFKRGILGSILAYESPATGAPASYAKAVQLLQVWEDTNATVKRVPGDTTMVVDAKRSGPQEPRRGQAFASPLPL